MRGTPSRASSTRKSSTASSQEDEVLSETRDEVESRPYGMNGDDYTHQTPHTNGEEKEEDCLPPPAMTKNLLAKFRSMEDVNATPPTPERSAKMIKAATISVSPGTSRRFSSPTKTVQVYCDTDEREQPEGLEEDDRLRYENEHYHAEEYQQYDHFEDTDEYENEPAVNRDIVREESRNEEEELPEQGTTRNLLAKFQSLQA